MTGSETAAGERVNRGPAVADDGRERSAGPRHGSDLASAHLEGVPGRAVAGSHRSPDTHLAEAT